MMPISGLLITLDRDRSQRASALAALRDHPSIDVGDGEDHRVPIVVDTLSSDEDRTVWEWLHELPGVMFVDVVYVYFDEDGQRCEASPHDPSQKRRETSSSHESTSAYHARGES